MWVYKQTEFAGRDGATYNLWTVGYYDPAGKWQPDSDHSEQEMAARRAAWLNGATGQHFPGSKTLRVGAHARR